MEKMKKGAYKELNVQYKKGSELQPIRLCIYRKTDAENVNSERNAKKANNSRVKHRNKLSDNQKFYSQYVIITTSMSETPDKILALYRQRWQIEVLFKRLKSIFCLDELPAKKDDSVKAWFYGKLLLAAICEALDNKGRFSP
jgi:transposase